MINSLISIVLLTFGASVTSSDFSSNVDLTSRIDSSGDYYASFNTLTYWYESINGSTIKNADYNKTLSLYINDIYTDPEDSFIVPLFTSNYNVSYTYISTSVPYRHRFTTTMSLTSK